MSVVAAAIIGSAVVGGVAANSAAKKGAKAADNATQAQLDQQNQTRADMAPWREAGGVALGQLTAGTVNGGEFNRNFGMADFQADPGYQFRMSEGMRGIESSAAARGGLLNGGTLRALNRYNQDSASGEFQNAYNRFNNDQSQRFNRLSSLAGTGQTVNTQLGQLGAQTANNVGNNMMQAANARASGYVGAANAITGATGSYVNNYQQQQYLNQLGANSVGPGSVYNTNPSSMGAQNGSDVGWYPG